VAGFGNELVQRQESAYQRAKQQSTVLSSKCGGIVGVFLGASTTCTNKSKCSLRVLGLRRTPPVVVRDVHGIYAPWDSAPVSVDGGWLGGGDVACCGGGGSTKSSAPLAMGLLVQQEAREREPRRAHRPRN
jgi:hypothetical protein